MKAKHPIPANVTIVVKKVFANVTKDLRRACLDYIELPNHSGLQWTKSNDRCPYENEISWMQWYPPVILATEEAEAEGFQV